MKFLFLPLVALALPVSAIAAASPADRSFLQKTMQGADYEIALARAAATSASRAEVRTYAQRIVKDHGQANPVLKRLLIAEGVPVPSGMTTSDTAKLAQIKTSRGVTFDKRYVDEVTRINVEDERDSATETRATKDARIKAYLNQFSKMDAEHKRMGEQLKTKVG